MAENVREGVSIVFADNVERTIYPVSLRGLRELNEAIKSIELEGTDIDTDTVDAMVDAARIVLKFNKIEVEDEEVEDIVDISNFNTMVAAAMGADPKELATGTLG